MNNNLITPDWSAPANVRACVTTRTGGCSRGAYTDFNLATHVGDNPEHVAENRRILRKAMGLDNEPQWLTQVHGSTVMLPGQYRTDAEADAAVAFEDNRVCAILTADCLPVFFCDNGGTRIGLAHAGWRGIKSGVLEETVAALSCAPGELLVWFGPAIGAHAFCVGDEVRDAFPSEDALCFLPDGCGKWMADIYLLARRRLERIGVTAIGGGIFCTYHDRRFYSYRREKTTGRMASLIWLSPSGG